MEREQQSSINTVSSFPIPILSSSEFFGGFIASVSLDLLLCPSVPLCFFSIPSLEEDEPKGCAQEIHSDVGPMEDLTVRSLTRRNGGCQT